MRMRLVERRVSADLPAGLAKKSTERWGLLLSLEDANGCRGIGEATPLPGYSPDAFVDVRAGLERLVDDVWPSSWDEEPVAAARRLGRRLPGLPAARLAIETAWLDLVARRSSVAFARLLGATRERAPLSALVGAVAVEAAIAEARAAVGRGIGTLKLKLATPAGLDADLERAAAVRAAVGPAVALRFDANGRLPIARVEGTLARLAELDAELLEEPMATAALLAGGPLVERLAASSVRLALDESLHGPEERERLWPLVERGVFRAVVLKPTCLGLLDALDLARRAADAGAAVVVTHAFEGPVALAAAAQLALAAPGELLACGLDRHAGLAAWPPVALPWLHDRAVVSTAEPGLGIAGGDWG